jgi:DNA-directed RNA polymerase sigma subunit (sigma70/sigma32)
MITMTRRKFDREELKRQQQQAQEENAEIRRHIDDLRRQGKEVNYAEIGRQYNLSRERIRQIDKNR